MDEFLEEDLRLVQRRRRDDASSSGSGVSEEFDPADRTVVEDLSGTDSDNSDDNMPAGGNPPAGAAATERTAEQQQEFTSLRRSRGQFGRSIDKAIVNAREVLAKDAPTRTEILTRKQRLGETFKNFEGAHLKILSLATDAEVGEDTATFDAFEEKYDRALAEIDEALDRLERASKEVTEAMAETLTIDRQKPTHKLPELKFRTFDGSQPESFDEWLRHANGLILKYSDDVVDIDLKVAELNSALKKDAKACTGEIVNTRAALDAAIARLKKRYGGRRPNIARMVRELVGLQLPGRSLQEWRRTFDDVKNKIDALGRRGVQIDTPGIAEILIPLMEIKMKSDLLEKWEARLHDKDADLRRNPDLTEEDQEYKPTIAEFLDFFDDRLAHQESAVMNRKAQEALLQPKKGQEGPQKTTAAALTANSNSGGDSEEKPKKKKKKKKGKGQQQEEEEQQSGCVFCSKENHASADCKSLDKMPFSAILRVVASKQLCRVCFEGHYTTQCKDTTHRCPDKECQDKPHHKKLH